MAENKNSELQEDAVVSKMETTVRKMRIVQLQLPDISGLLQVVIKIFKTEKE